MENNNEDKKNYMTMLKAVLKNLYEYLQEIVPPHKKSELIPFYSFNEAILLVGVINLNRGILDSECHKYMHKYEIGEEHKSSIYNYLEMIVSIGEKIKNAMCVN